MPHYPFMISSAEVTDKELLYVVDMINNRQRKHLNFLTPYGINRVKTAQYIEIYKYTTVNDG